ncbi:MAG: hypothetical protein D6776_06650, partial [Planctomycetota bacterium]
MTGALVLALLGALAARGDTGPDGNIVHVPESRFVEVELGRAERLASAGRWKRAARIWVRILREQRAARAGIQHVSPVGEGRYVSYVRLVRQRLLRLGPEGIAAVREAIGGEARVAFAAARKRLDPGAYEAVWRSYPVAREGAEALERAGDLWYERGRGVRALRCYGRARRVPDTTLDPDRLDRKIEAARRLVRAQEQAARERRAREASAPWIGRRQLPKLRTPAALGAMRASHPLLPRGRAAMRWGRLRRTPPVVRLGQRIDPVGFADILASVAEGRCVVANGRSIACYDVERGSALWRQVVWEGEDHNPDLFYGATIAGGRVFAPFVVKVSRAEHYRGIPIKVPIPTRRLVAFDLETGRRVWDHTDPDDPFLSKASVALPPVVCDGRLYAGAVVREGQLKNYLICVDAETGALLWRRYLGAGQVEMTMFGEHAREPLAMQPVLAGDRIYHATGTGLLACVSVPSGDLEWITRYAALPIRSAQSYYAIRRPLVWRNTAPIVLDGVLVVAPVDASRCYGVDADTGAIRWWIDGIRPSRLAGVHADRAVLLGPRRITLVEVGTGK